MPIPFVFQETVSKPSAAFVLAKPASNWTKSTPKIWFNGLQ